MPRGLTSTVAGLFSWIVDMEDDSRRVEINLQQTEDRDSGETLVRRADRSETRLVSSFASRRRRRISISLGVSREQFVR